MAQQHSVCFARRGPELILQHEGTYSKKKENGKTVVHQMAYTIL